MNEEKAELIGEKKIEEKGNFIVSFVVVS